MTPQAHVAAAPERLARPAVAGRIAAALDSSSVLLIAEAGFGKTLALEEACRMRASATAWVSCTDRDHDAGGLLVRLAAAVRQTVPGALDVLAEDLASAQQRVDVRAATQTMLAELDRLLVDELVIVLDGAETLAHSEPAALLLGDLLRAGVPPLRLALTSRRTLPIKVAKLRAAGRLTQFGPRELAFNATECAELLRIRYKREPSTDEIETVMAATHGWPLGVSLSGLADLSNAPLPQVSRDQIFTYLAEEVLDGLEPALRSALIDSSLPHALNDQIAAALALPASFLDDVHWRGLFLRTTDPTHRVFSYHPLFRDFLRERLTTERTSAERRELHARVAMALDTSGRRDEAVDHWLEAAAWQRAAEAIASAGPALVHTQPDVVRGWLDALPAELRSSPPCLVLDGTLAWEDGNNMEAVARLRAAAAAFERSGDVVGHWLARFALIDPLILTGEWSEAIALAKGFDEEPALIAGIVPAAVACYAVASLSGVGRMAESDELAARLAAHPHLGMLESTRGLWQIDKLLLAGDFDELIAGGREAVDEAEMSDPFKRLPLFSLELATALTHQGYDAEALEAWQRVEATARETHMSFVLTLSHAWRALLHARNGRPAPAEHELARAGPVGSGWRAAVHEAAHARTAALAGNAAAVLSAADRAMALAERGALADRLLVALEVAPALFTSGFPDRARAVTEDHLALCDAVVPGAAGSYARSLLLATRAWLLRAEGRARDATTNVVQMWDSAGTNAPDLVRRQWPLVEPLLHEALKRGALDAVAVIGAVEIARPGGQALLPFASHPESRVRRAAIASLASSGHPAIAVRLAALQKDPDSEVAAAAKSASEHFHANPPPLVFQLLGGFELRRGSWPIGEEVWERPIAAKLVRFFLVHRDRVVAEDELFEAFWPGKPPATARRNLQVTVSRARAVLDPRGATRSVLESGERAYRLRLGDRDRVDVDEFETAAAAGLGEDGRARRHLLERARSLWTGEPLPADRYAEWSLAWRERLIDRFGEVLSAHADACRAEGDDVAALTSARELVELDPLNEMAQRQLIAAYARAGRTGHALRQYLECRRTLVDELGIEPSEATSQLQMRILAGELV